MLNSKLKSLILKIVRSPRTFLFLFFDRLVVPLGLKLAGVRTGRNCLFAGFPNISMAQGAHISLGSGVIICSRSTSNPAGLPHATILAALSPQSHIVIGNDTGISGASIVARSAITIGKRVLIGAGACIWDTDFHPVDPDQRLNNPTRDAQCAPIKVDDEVFIGARAIILKGVHIGRRAVIGAGAVVTKNVKSGDVVVGNPARAVGSVNSARKGGSSP